MIDPQLKMLAKAVTILAIGQIALSLALIIHLMWGASVCA